MSTLANQTIAALRSEHDVLAALVPTLSDTALTGSSGASEWSVADVLSHLGSGAEITLAGLNAALGGPTPADGFNQGVWDRWNALPPQQQASAFLASDTALVERLEGLDADQRASLAVPIGFLPAPLPVATFAGMRLSEVAQHSWDVRVAVEPDATLSADAADVLLDQFSSGLGFLLGWLGKTDSISEPVVLGLGGHHQVHLGDGVTLTAGAADTTAAFEGAPEAAIRLIGGRLTPTHTPAGLTVTGNVTLDELREVFPGF